jgi:hypothetical protein
MPGNGKPRSNAERQAAYRRRHLHDLAVEDVEMLARLNLLISVLAKGRLERLAACYGVTQRSLLEHALDEAENIAVTTLPGRALNDYYDKRPTPLRGRAPISAYRLLEQVLPGRWTTLDEATVEPARANRAGEPVLDVA